MRLFTAYAVAALVAACGSSAALSNDSDAGNTIADASTGADGSAPSDASTSSDAPSDARSASDASKDGGADSSGDAGRKRVFVSSATYTGLLDPDSGASNGIVDGDRMCNSLAHAAGLGGTWRAFLASYSSAGGAVSAPDHITEVGPWYLVDGTTLVFAGKSAFDAGPAHPLDRDERGMAVADAAAWTGVSGSLTFCNSWTSESPNNRGLYGVVGATNGDWFLTPSANPFGPDAGASCDHLNHLYCFEQ